MILSGQSCHCGYTCHAIYIISVARAHSVLTKTKTDEVKSPLTCRSHQDHRQPRPADLEPAAAAAAAAAVKAGKAGTLDTHPEAALPAVAVVAAVAVAHYAQA